MCYPMPMFIIETYNADGTPNAMNAVWGGISEEADISISVDFAHRTDENLIARKAFTVSMATAKHVDGVLRQTLPKLEQSLPKGRCLEIE